MTRPDRAMVEKNLDLIFEFERYVAEHPRFAGKIPEKAAKDPDTQLFLRRRKERLEDCLAAIERRIAHIKKRRA